MGLFIPKETLDALSYRSTLGRSLKQISLRATPLETILEDIAKYRASYGTGELDWLPLQK